MPNRAKHQSRSDGKAFLKERLIEVETAFIQDLKRYQASITHDGTMGDATEDAWIELLRRYLPARYRVAKAFAVDHKGNTTDQLDCLIYDAHFTPALFGKEKHLYVPAEAVYATCEVKPAVDARHVKYAARKIASLRALARTSAPLESILGTNPARPPVAIIGGLLGMSAAWTDGLGVAFLSQVALYSGVEQLDLVLTAENGFYDHLDPSKAGTVISGPGALVRGLFRLLTALRSKASVTAVEWDKYEAVFEPE